jgi:hypothetical protein
VIAMPVTLGSLDAAANAWLPERLATLAAGPWSYGPQPPSAAEPAALAALALIACREWSLARQPVVWLASLQQPDGAVGVSASEDAPHWPTAWAMLAWQACRQGPDVVLADALARQIELAAQWSLAHGGKTSERPDTVGHDTTLRGWSWAEGTHSWLEPTCLFVVALRTCGLANHARTREGQRLIVDRLLPAGGANYGNTTVLGNTLLPHLHATGLALLALADSGLADPRIDASLDWLAGKLGPDAPGMSLGLSLLGLTAWGRRPEQADAWLTARLAQSDVLASPYQQALLLLALADVEAQAELLGYARPRA